MKKLYHIFDPQTLEIIGAGFYEIKPENSTEAKNENYIKPMYNIDNDTIYDGATLEEIAEMEIQKVAEYRTKIYELTDKLKSKLITDLDNLHFEKIDAKIALVQTITNDTDLNGIMEIKNPI